VARGFAQVWTVPSRSSSARSQNLATTDLCAPRGSCTTRGQRPQGQGAIFIEKNSPDVPTGATLCSPTASAKAIQAKRKERGFNIFDATCPFVTKVHV
jgi:hypothetical protein